MCRDRFFFLFFFLTLYINVCQGLREINFLGLSVLNLPSALFTFFLHVLQEQCIILFVFSSNITFVVI